MSIYKGPFVNMWTVCTWDWYQWCWDFLIWSFFQHGLKSYQQNFDMWCNRMVNCITWKIIWFLSIVMLPSPVLSSLLHWTTLPLFIFYLKQEDPYIYLSFLYKICYYWFMYINRTKNIKNWFLYNHNYKITINNIKVINNHKKIIN